MADPFDEDDTVQIRSGPAYNPNPWNKSGGNFGPQCSQSGEFCFLCYGHRKNVDHTHAPQEDRDGDGNESEDMSDRESSEAAYEKRVSVGIDDDNPEKTKDYVAVVEDTITTMIAEDKELPYIVKAVADFYKKRIKAHVKYRSHETGCTVRAPAWTEEAVRRHITFSKKWPQIFEDNVNHTIHAIMESQQMFLRDLDTGMIIQERLKDYYVSLDQYMKLNMHRVNREKILLQNNALRRKQRRPAPKGAAAKLSARTGRY